MRGVGVGVAAAVGAEHLDGDLRGHRPLDDGLFLHLLIHHDWHIGHHRLPFVIELRHVHHHRHAIGHYRLALVIEFGRLHHDRDIGRHRLAFGVGLGHLRGVGLREFGFRVWLEVLNHALRHKDDREDDANGQQQVVGRPYEVHPEVAQGLGRVPGKAAHERRRDGNAGGRRDEVVDDERDHLREIGHGGFAGVALPIGVGGKAGRGVERQVGTERAQALGIERQQVLHPQDDVGEEATHQAEEQHGNSVLLPILLLVRLRAHHAIGDSLQGFEDRVEPGPAFRIQDLHEVQAHRFRNQGEGRHKQHKLQPINRAHEGVLRISPAEAWPRAGKRTATGQSRPR